LGRLEKMSIIIARGWPLSLEWFIIMYCYMTLQFYGNYCGRGGVEAYI
jgi:hypothetical protein